MERRRNQDQPNGIERGKHLGSFVYFTFFIPFLVVSIFDFKAITEKNKITEISLSLYVEGYYVDC